MKSRSIKIFSIIVASFNGTDFILSNGHMQVQAYGCTKGTLCTVIHTTRSRDIVHDRGLFLRSDHKFSIIMKSTEVQTLGAGHALVYSYKAPCGVKTLDIMYIERRA